LGALKNLSGPIPSKNQNPYFITNAFQKSPIFRPNRRQQNATTMLYQQIQEAVAFIRSQTNFQAQSAIVLGTGLGNLTDDIDITSEIAYSDIPHFARSTVESHKGKLVFGTLGGHPVVAMAGRFHWYEGWSMQQVVFPVRVLRFLGIERLVVTNVSGGINPHLQAGDLVLVRDHINLLPENPLRGANDERIGPRFPDLLNTYDPELRKKALEIAKKHQIRAIEGVYSALPGPNLETPAEYEMLRHLGSDCTGMSSVPEVLAAKHMGLAVMMISMVSNVSFPRSAIRETTLEEVIQVAQKAEPRLRLLIRELLVPYTKI
jgi:purine-nucleoside phosphorylase